MGLFLDFVVIVAALVFLWKGLKNGFFKSIIDLIIMILSVVVPYLFAPMVAEYYYNNFVQNDLLNKINNILNQDGNIVSSAKNILSLIGNIPNFFKNSFILSEVNINDILKVLKSSGDKSLIIADLLKPSIIKIITLIAFAILTILTFIVFKLIFKYALKLPKIPLFGIIDSILGLCMGTLKFVVFMFIFVVIFKSACFIVPETTFSQTISLGINDSKIFKVLYNINLDVLKDYLKLQ